MGECGRNWWRKGLLWAVVRATFSAEKTSELKGKIVPDVCRNGVPRRKKRMCKGSEKSPDNLSLNFHVLRPSQQSYPHGLPPPLPS